MIENNTGKLPDTLLVDSSVADALIRQYINQAFMIKPKSESKTLNALVDVYPNRDKFPPDDFVFLFALGSSGLKKITVKEPIPSENDPNEDQAPYAYDEDAAGVIEGDNDEYWEDDVITDDTDPVDEEPTEENPTEENPVEEVPTEDPNTNEESVDEVSTEENPTEENPVDEEVPTEEVPTEDPNTNENASSEEENTVENSTDSSSENVENTTDTDEGTPEGSLEYNIPGNPRVTDGNTGVSVDVSNDTVVTEEPEEPYIPSNEDTTRYVDKVVAVTFDNENEDVIGTVNIDNYTEATIVKENDEFSHLDFTNVFSMPARDGSYNPNAIMPLHYLRYSKAKDARNYPYFTRTIHMSNGNEYFGFYSKALGVKLYREWNKNDPSKMDTIIQFTGEFNVSDLKAMTDCGTLLKNKKGYFGEISLYVGVRRQIEAGMVINGKMTSYDEVMRAVPFYRIAFPYLTYDSFDSDKVRFTLNINIGESTLGNDY